MAMSKDAPAPGPSKYVEPHERASGPWDDYELDDAARHIEGANRVAKNGKFAEAVAKHMEKKAARHKESARHARHLAKHGLISEAAMNRVAKKAKD